MDRGALRIGIDLKDEANPSELSVQDLLECASEAERLGFDSVWTNEDIGRDSIALLSAIAATTRTIGIGTAIVNDYTRSALQLAMGIATLDDISAGRAVLGLSVGHHPWNDLGHGIPLEPPLPRLREYVEFIRKALTSKPFTHDGPVFSGVDTCLGFQAPRADLPIYIAGERTGMIGLAGRVADGVLVNVVSSNYVGNFVAERFYDAARKAGRDRDRLELMTLVTCCLDDDPAVALEQARGMFLTRLKGGLARRKEILEPRFHEEVVALRALVDAGHPERAREEASEALVRSIIVAGNAEQIWSGIERYFAAGCTRIAVVSWPRGRDHVLKLLRALAATRSAGAGSAPVGVPSSR